MGLYEDLTVDAALEAWFDCQDDRDDLCVLDASDNGNTGTLSGAASTTAISVDTGPNTWLPKALDLDGSDDVVTIADSSALRFDAGTLDFSISAWIKRDATGVDDYILDKRDADNDGYVLYVAGSDDKLKFSLDAIDITSASTLSTTWTHVAVAIDRSGNGQLYINGMADGSAVAISSEAMATTADLLIGGDAVSTGEFDGQLAEVVIFSKLLTQAEVNALYAGPNVRKLGGEKLWICPTICNSPGGAIDLSGEGSNGSLEGGLATTTYSEREGTDAFDCDGVGDYVDVAGYAALSPEVADWSLSTWFKHSGSVIASVGETIYSAINTAGGDWLQLKLTEDGYLSLSSDDGTNSYTVTGTTDLQDGAWHHAVVLMNRTTSKQQIWVDGIYIDEATLPPGSISADGEALIGAVWGSGGANQTPKRQFFDGLIDDVRIFDRVCSDTEIAKLASTPAYQSPIKTLGSKVLHLSPTLMEGGASTQPDISYNGNNGTLSGATIVDDTEMGGTRAFSFDGVNDYVEVVDNSNTEITAMGLNSYPFTATVWVKATADGVTQGILFIGDIVTTDRYNSIQVGSDNKFKLSGRNTGSEIKDDSGVSADGDWHHLAVVWSSATERNFYVDGDLKVTGTTSIAIVSGVYDRLRVGGYGDSTPDRYFSGSIDDVQIYSRALAADEIARLASKRGYQLPKRGVGKEVLRLCPTQDDRDGTFDLSYSANNGTLNGNATTAADTDAGGSIAFSLDGTGDYISVADASGLRFDSGTLDFSLSCWCKRTGTGATDYLIDKRDADNDGYVLYIHSDDKVYFSLDAIDIVSSSTVSTSWTHVAVRIDRDGNGTIYINGTADGTPVAISSEAMATTAALRVGIDYAGSNGFAGLMDDIRIFGYALSPNQIAMLFDAGEGRGYELPLIGDEVVAYLPSLDTANNGSTTEITDLSGNGRHGTLNGSMTAGDWVAITDKGGITALDLDGTDDYIDAGDLESLDFAPQFTLSFFINQTTLDLWDTIFENGTGSERISVLTYTDGNLFIEPKGGPSNRAYWDYSANITAGEWHHLCIVFDGSGIANADRLKVFVDGVKISLTFSGTITSQTGDNSGASLRIGYNASAAFLGQLADIRIFDRDVTPTEIKHLASQIDVLERPAADPIAPVFWYCPSLDPSRNQTGVTSDLSDESNNGVLTSMDAATDWPADVSNGGYWANDFDGTDDHILIGDVSGLRFDAGTLDFSISAWIKRDATGAAHYIVDKRDADNDGYVLYVGSDNKLHASIGTKDIVSTNTISTSWVFVALVVDRDGNGQLYINGSADGSAVAISAEVMATTADLRIGSDIVSTGEFNGRIDDVRIYDKAITAAQVSTLYESGTGRGHLLVPPVASTFSAYWAHQATKLAGVMSCGRM